MKQLRAILLVLIYAVTLTTVPVSARSYAFIATSSESAEKESVTNSTFEHRESSSIKVTGKLVNTRKYLAGKCYPALAEFDINSKQGNALDISVPAYILHCVYRL